MQVRVSMAWKVDDLCVHVDSDDICLLHTQGVPPQLNIGAFAHVQSNGVDGTEDWEMGEAESPPTEDHLNSNALDAGVLGF